MTKLIVVFRNYSKAPNAKVLIIETRCGVFSYRATGFCVYQNSLVLKWLINEVIV